MAPRDPSPLSRLLSRGHGEGFFLFKKYMKNIKQNRGYNTIIFDCDSTLTTIEGVDWLAHLKGKTDEVSVLTRLAMDGQVSFESVLEHRLNIIKPSYQDLVNLGHEYIKTSFPDAKETIRKLLTNNMQIYIVSGGYKIAIDIFAQWLGIRIDNVFAIDINFDKYNNYIDVNIDNLLAKNNGKLNTIQKLNLTKKTILVGDGATDLEAKGAVDLFIGFGGVVSRQIVRDHADIFINTLSSINYLV